jgi:2-keto-4-pentenoate hydratase/2-oxohepta-3-ene-1,7-dioic acid hydratase in catechol pathway
MKLVTFQKRGEAAARAGAFLAGDQEIVDLQEAYRARYGKPAAQLESVLAIAEGGQTALDVVAEVVKGARATAEAIIGRADVTMHAPIPRPPQMRDFLCFEKHLQQGFYQARKLRASASPDPEAAMCDMEANGILVVPKVWYERPIFYHPNRLNVIGTDTDVRWPSFCERFDFELEFGFYIGKPGIDITRETARDHIFGYTIFNDFSARDEQTKEMAGQLGPGKGKDFDGGNAMGPCLVTADEIGDPYRLDMAVRVNGEEWGRGNSRDMHWKFEDCIAHVARSETLHPGEFFGSGTVGDGCGLEHMRFLKSGDVIELEVEKIGVLRNRVVRT